MIVGLIDKDVINTFWETFGLTYSDGELHGRIRNFSDTIPDTIPEHERNMYYKILKAYMSTSNKEVHISAYVGDLTQPELDGLIGKGFYINIHRALVIYNLTYETYMLIKLSRDDVDDKAKVILNNLLDRWPKVDVIESGSTGKPLVTELPRFDYAYGSDRYHVCLPFPIGNSGRQYLPGYVEVRILDGSQLFNHYKYLVMIADYPTILTNILPTPDAIEDIIEEDKRTITKLKHFYYKIKLKLIPQKDELC